MEVVVLFLRGILVDRTSMRSLQTAKHLYSSVE
jgi:hypothetical protein